MDEVEERLTQAELMVKLLAFVVLVLLSVPAEGRSRGWEGQGSLGVQA
jgi:hypothetical protein